MALIPTPTAAQTGAQITKELLNKMLQAAAARRLDMLRQYGANPKVAQDIEKYYANLVQRINQMYTTGQPLPNPVRRTQPWMPPNQPTYPNRPYTPRTPITDLSKPTPTLPAKPVAEPQAPVGYDRQLELAQKRRQEAMATSRTPLYEQGMRAPTTSQTGLGTPTMVSPVSTQAAPARSRSLSNITPQVPGVRQLSNYQ